MRLCNGVRRSLENAVVYLGAGLGVASAAAALLMLPGPLWPQAKGKHETVNATGHAIPAPKERNPGAPSAKAASENVPQEKPNGAAPTRSAQGIGTGSDTGTLKQMNLILSVITTAGVLLALYFYAHQAWAAIRDHMNNVHQVVFERLDKPDVRGARHYVYGMDTTPDATGMPQDRAPVEIRNLVYETEGWLALGTDGWKGKGAKDDCERHKSQAELIARALDQLGYLVREGIVPLNVVARFYSYPVLRCWYQLSPYIAAVRDARGQHGHMWEWEHLVETIIDGSSKDKGLWNGTGRHDNLNAYAKKISDRTRASIWTVSGATLQKFPTDSAWKPPDRSDEWRLPLLYRVLEWSSKKLHRASVPGQANTVELPKSAPRAGETDRSSTGPG